MPLSKSKYILNTTFSADKSISQDWLEWFKTTHLPSIYASGLLESYQVMRIASVEDDTGDTFCAHITFKSDESFNHFTEKIQSQYENMILNKFGQQVLFFSTVLEVI